MEQSHNIPNLFIIGAPKCGTTSMMHYLSQHPEIFASTVKEPHFFNTDGGHRYFFKENKYLSLFKMAKEYHKYCVEGSVWYLYSKVAVDNILKFNPNAKFIVMLRNPVEMFFSLHQELLFGGAESVKSPKKAWDLQKDRLKGNRIPYGCVDPDLLQYGEVCKLGIQAERIRKIIPQGNLKFVLMDDLRKDPDTTFKSVLNFLNIQPVTLDSYEVVNIKKVRKSLILSKFFIFITDLKIKLGIRKGLGLTSAINKVNITHGASLDQSDVSLMFPDLIKYFKEDIELLESVIKRNLADWKKMEYT